MMRKLIRTDGTSMDLPSRLSSAEIRTLIGVETLGTVNLRHMGAPLHVMLIDDEGYESQLVEKRPGHFELRPVRARKPVNVEATRLYHLNCIPAGMTHQIVGDVVVVPDDDFE